PFAVRRLVEFLERHRTPVALHRVRQQPAQLRGVRVCSAAKVRIRSARPLAACITARPGIWRFNQEGFGLEQLAFTMPVLAFAS
ncbi:hypothetical protein ACWHA1_38185, partial [Streptomyces decoyicus]